jgi:lysozyme family protein
MNFQTAIERILKHEGGYVFDRRDPGGETQWGISKRSYPDVDIKRLTREQAKGLYERDFWRPVVETVALPALQFQLLDAAVNHGMGNAVRFLQRAVGVADDGHWGQVSHAALARMSAADVLALFMAERFEFWAKLRTFDTFGRGWVRRGAENLRFIAADN